MSARRILVRLAAFFAAYAAALSLVLLLKPAPPRPFIAHPSPGPAFSVARDLDVEAELISLDRESGRSYTRLRLWHSFGPQPPARLRVRTYFFTAEGPARRVWSSEAELRDPFGARPDAAVTVAADCDWCADADAPRGGYFARVQVSTDSEESELPAGERFFDIKTAVPVVVHVERGAARPRARD
jgi:hypothetical protein